MTAKLVKARPKAVEYLPEWMKCCPKCLEDFYDIGDVVIDLLQREPCKERICGYCGASGPATGIIAPVKGSDEFWIRLDVFDLDEGPTA